MWKWIRLKNGKPSNKISLWYPLREKGFGRLFAGQVLSDMASWLDFVALSTLLVYTWGYGSMELAALSICIGLPYVAVGPFISVRTQYMHAKTLMIVCDLLRAGTALALAFVPSLPILLILVLLKSSVSATFDPLRQGAVKRLVSPRMIAQASSLSQMSVNFTKIIGPAVGGALMTVGASLPFLTSSGMYILSAVMLSLIPAWSGIVSKAEKEKPSLRKAWRHIIHRPMLKGAIIFASTMFFLIFLYDGLFPLLTKEAGMNESELGLLIGAVGLGSVAGAIVAGQWSGWQRRPLAYMTLAGLASGGLIVIVGIMAVGVVKIEELIIWAALFVMLGFTGAQSAVPFGYVLQSETSETTIGPVSALSNAIQTCSMLLAPVLGALLAAWIGAGGVLITVGAMTIAVAGIFRFRTARARTASAEEVNVTM